MTFEDLLNDVEKLIGLRLNSIRPGAEIIIESIDRKNGSLSLRNAQGNFRKRNLDELKNLWKELQKNKIVHVDGFLHGSGSSRNQPETILANLPYIEWLKYNGKKHLAFVEEKTHVYGTIKKMNAMYQMIFCEHLPNAINEKGNFSIAIVTDNIKQSIDAFNKDSAFKVEFVEQEAYSLIMPNARILFLSSEKYKLSKGCYPILISGIQRAQGERIKLFDVFCYIVQINGINVLQMEKEICQLKKKC